jgi:hypothetical protein
MPLAGKIFKAEIRNGIDGTLAVDFDPTDWSSGSTWTSSETGEVWTKNGNAYVGGHTVSNESTITMDAVPEADDTAKTLDIKVTGVAATRMVWNSTITLTEVVTP